MATVTGLTAERMLEIEAASIVDGHIDGSGHLILEQHDGTEIDAGNAVATVPDASTTVKGKVELATTAETDAHTDTTRAVTPASLVNYDARIDTLEAETGTKVQILADNYTAESTAGTSYPSGISMFNCDNPTPNWSPAQYGLVVTYREGSYRIRQMFYDDASVGNRIWTRGYHAISGWTGWGILAMPTIPETMGMPGEIKVWSASTAPTGWHLCDGGAISRTNYPALYALVGTAYGVGDGSTTFNVPNLKGKVVVGYNSSETEFDTLGETGGAKTHTLSIAEMPAHIHDIGEDTTNGWAASSAKGLTKNATAFVGGAGSDRTPNATNSLFVQSKGGGGAHNNLQPYFVLNYIIKL